MGSTSNRVIGGRPRVVSEASIRSEGLQLGGEGNVWATSMAPEDFAVARVGGEWGADLIGNFPFLQSFTKNYAEGFVVKIKDTSSFVVSTTYWKALLGQYESSTPIPPSDIEILH